MSATILTLGNKWENLKEKRKERIKLLRESNHSEEKVPDNVAGVNIKDEILIEKFGDKAKEPAVYGGIEITDEIKDFLKLPAGLRLFPKMNLMQDEARAEEAAVIERWNIMSGDCEMDPEELRSKRHEENKLRMVSDGKKVNFSNMRATDFPQNKDLIVPQPVRIKDELRIQSQRE